MIVINKKLRLIRRIVQYCLFALFLFLFLKTQYSGEDDLAYPVNLFLRLDPLLALTSMLSARAWIEGFFVSLFIVISTLALGRIWCGWICPMGTAIDILRPIFKTIKPENKNENLRKLKYYILFFMIASSLFSLSLAGYLDPISILTRTITLSIYPAVNAMVENSLIAGYSSEVGWLSNLADSIYSYAKQHILAFEQPIYYLNFFTFFIFFGILFLEKFQRRFWCRNLCPLGALLAMLSPFALIKRIPVKQCADCENGCDAVCRLNIFKGKKQEDQIRKECIYCFDCIDACPNGRVKYSFGLNQKKSRKVDLTRRGIIYSAGAGALALPLLRIHPTSAAEKLPTTFIRPPGSEPEAEFSAKCARCGECMRVCVKNAIQPAFLEAGLEGLWTPKIVPRIGYCEFDCTLCGQVCPSQALKKLSLEEKHKFVIGKAFFDKNRCIPYAKEIDCIVCEEHCPTLPKKAIRFKEKEIIEADGSRKTIKEPFIDEELCIGCGICENKCPLEKRAGVIVFNQKKIIKEGFSISNSYG